MHDDAPGVAPEIPLVVLAEPLAGKGMRLARDAANDAIHEAADAPAREGSHIAPHSCFSQETFTHRCDQMGNREGFPLHHNDAAQRRACELKSEVEAAPACAEADDVELFGMYSHIQSSPRVDLPTGSPVLAMTCTARSSHSSIMP